MIRERSLRGACPSFYWALGTALGIVLAASGAFSPATELAGASGDVIARVNERSIRTDTYERARALVATDKRNPMSDADRAHVLRRLIEEELLIQRGETIGLVDLDPTVRKSIVAAMIQSIVAQSESEKPDPEASSQLLRRKFGLLHASRHPAREADDVSASRGRNLGGCAGARARGIAGSACEACRFTRLGNNGPTRSSCQFPTRPCRPINCGSTWVPHSLRRFVACSRGRTRNRLNPAPAFVGLNW